MRENSTVYTLMFYPLNKKGIGNKTTNLNFGKPAKSNNPSSQHMQGRNRSVHLETGQRETLCATLTHNPSVRVATRNNVQQKVRPERIGRAVFFIISAPKKCQ